MMNMLVNNINYHQHVHAKQQQTNHPTPKKLNESVHIQLTVMLHYLAPGGGCEVLFSPGLSVCLSVCVSVCPANILVFYCSAIRRDIDLKFIQDTYIVVLNSLK